MYDDIKKFLHGKDDKFNEELEKINNLDILDDLKDDKNDDLCIINKYKQTDAYKRLLKRQGLAVKRIERIKENFEKKRKQVTMLAVQRENMKNNHDDLDRAEESNAQGFEDYQQSNSSKYELNNNSFTLPIYQNRPYASNNLKPILSSQQPLSYQVILEERSSIATQPNIDKKFHQSKNDLKHKQIVEPYMKTCQQYFNRLNKSLNKSNCGTTTSKKLNQSLLSQNELSQYYMSSGNISQSPGTNQKTNQNTLRDINALTGMSLYQQEIAKNRATNKSQDQKAFYQPSIIKNPIQPFSQIAKRHISSNYSSNGFQTNTNLNKKRQNLISRNQKNRPQTTEKLDEGKPLNRHLINIDIKTQGGISTGEQVLHSDRVFSNDGSSKKLPSQIAFDEYKSQQFPNIINMKEQIVSQLSNHKSNINEEVKEQEEECEESRLQSQIQTLNKEEILNNSRQKAILNDLNSTSSKFHSESRKNQTSERFYHLKATQNLQKSESTTNGNRKIKNTTPIQRYNMMKNQIVQNIKSKEYWPQHMKHPDDFKGFYWTPDLSFCGFLPSSNVSNSGQLVKRKQQKNPLQNSMFRQYLQQAKEDLT